MINPEVYTIKSFKKSAFLCLKLTIIFGLLFGVVFGQRTLENIIWSFIISGMYCFGLGFGNILINNYLSSKWDWITLTNQRIWSGIIATILYTVPVVLSIDYIVFVVLNGVDVAVFFKGNYFWIHLF